MKVQRANKNSLPFGAFGSNGRKRGGSSSSRRGGRMSGGGDEDDFNFMFPGANPFEQFFR